MGARGRVGIRRAEAGGRRQAGGQRPAAEQRRRQRRKARADGSSRARSAQAKGQRQGQERGREVRLTQERVRLVNEEQQPAARALRPVKGLVQLRDRVAAQRGNVPSGEDGIVQPRGARQALGGHRLAGAGRAWRQGGAGRRQSARQARGPLAADGSGAGALCCAAPRLSWERRLS